MIASRPLGWLPDEPGAVKIYTPNFGLDTPKPRGATPRAPWTNLIQVNQSCTWNGAAHAVYSKTGKKTSPYPGYYHSLAEKYPYIAADPKGIMPDEGLSISQIMESFENSGTCEWEFWNPSTPGFNPGKRPPWRARVDSQRHNLTISLVLGTGDALFRALACAIDEGDFPLLALDVDEAFMRFTGAGLIGKQSGPSLGGHLVSMWDHKFDDGEATIGNYWPLDDEPWGTGNLGRISAERIAQARAGFIVHEIS